MERKIAETCPALSVMNVTLVPIVETSLSCWHNGTGISVFGIKKPIGVVVVSPLYKKVITVDGEEFPVEQFLAEHPGVNTGAGQI
jgi:hypothetical protein